jgi:hypothetical protein
MDIVQLAFLILMSVIDLERKNGWTDTGGSKIKRIKKENIPFKFKLSYAACSVPYRATYNALEAHLMHLEQDLTNKEHSLMTDLRCLDMRDALKKSYVAPPTTQTKRNFQLTRMEEEEQKP